MKCSLRSVTMIQNNCRIDYHLMPLQPDKAAIKDHLRDKFPLDSNDCPYLVNVNFTRLSYWSHDGDRNGFQNFEDIFCIHMDNYLRRLLHSVLHINVLCKKTNRSTFILKKSCKHNTWQCINFLKYRMFVT